MSSSKGKEVVPRCAACRLLQRECGTECVFAPHFPSDDDPARFAAVHTAFGADNVAQFLHILPPDWHSGRGGRPQARPPRPAAVGGAAAVGRKAAGACVACKYLRWRCALNCVFAPHFPLGDDPKRFAAVHRVYGAANLSKWLSNVPPELSGDAAASFVYEARCRHRDSVLGITGDVAILSMVLKLAEELLTATREELARYIGEEAASSSFVPAHEPQEVATMQELEDIDPMEPPLPVAPTAAAGLPETEDAGDEFSQDYA